MGDPQRLLSEISDADELERSLLGSLQHIEPPAHAKGEAWVRLSAQLATVGLAGAAHASVAAASGTTAAATSGTGSALGTAPLGLLGSKLAVGLALSASVLGASALWVDLRSAPTPTVATVAAPPVAVPLPTPVVPTLVSTAASAAVAPPRPSTPASERPSKPSAEVNATDRLSAESALLTQARAQLRGGDAAAAAQSLARLRANFPKGVLGQEREVLAIEVLAAQGNAEAARRRAKAFIFSHPTSPHSPQLSRFADAP